MVPTSRLAGSTPARPNVPRHVSIPSHACAAATLCAVELLHGVYSSGRSTWPKSPPTSFLRPAWRDAVLSSGPADAVEHRRTWEAATLLALSHHLRAGDIWVEGSRQWRAIEDQLISPALFSAMRKAGPLPVAVSATAEEYLTERRALLDRRMGRSTPKPPLTRWRASGSKTAR